VVAAVHGNRRQLRDMFKEHLVFFKEHLVFARERVTPNQTNLGSSPDEPPDTRGRNVGPSDQRTLWQD